MFVFLHGSGATSSLWLPAIRGILSLDQTYSDKYLLDLFTLPLPGHPEEDREFTTDDIIKQIQDFISTKWEKQYELASKLIFSSNREAVQQLRNHKIVITGQEVGSVLALEFALKHPSLVQSLVLSSIGESVNFWEFWINRLLWNRAALGLHLSKIRALAESQKNLRKRTLFTIMAENPQRKGLLSAEKILGQFRFGAKFKLISLDDQIHFFRLPILILSGQSDSLFPPSALFSLLQTLEKYQKTISAKVDNVEGENVQNRLQYKLFPKVGEFVADDDLTRYVSEVREFLKQN